MIRIFAFVAILCCNILTDLEAQSNPNTTAVPFSVIGKWQNVADPSLFFEFFNNGTFKYYSTSKQGEALGSFQLENNQLTIYFSNNNQMVTSKYSIYRIGNDESIFMIDGNGGSVGWNKVSDSEPYKSKSIESTALSNNINSNHGCSGTYYMNGVMGDGMSLMRVSEITVQINAINKQQYSVYFSPYEKYVAQLQGNQLIVPGNQIPGWPYSHGLVIDLQNGSCENAAMQRNFGTKFTGTIHKNIQKNQNVPTHTSASNNRCSCCNGSGDGAKQSCSSCSGRGYTENDKTDTFGNITRTSYSCGSCSGTGKTTSWAGCSCCGGRGRN